MSAVGGVADIDRRPALTAFDAADPESPLRYRSLEAIGEADMPRVSAAGRISCALQEKQ